MILYKNFKRLLLGLCLVGFSPILQAEAIFFDLGYVLCEPDKMGLSNEIGALDYISYSFWEGKSSDDLRICMFDILSLMGTQEGDEENLVCTDTGYPFPAILVDWQCGTVTGKEIYDEALGYLEELKALKYFSSKCEYRLVKNSLRIMLDPAILANNMKTINKGLKLVHELSEMVDDQGNPIHELYILSNFDPDSFEILYNHKDNQKLFGYFKPGNIVVSGKIGLAKPHRDIFEYLFKTYNLKAENCILIDDQKENINAARKCGIKSFHCKNMQYKKLREQLKDAKIL